MPKPCNCWGKISSIGSIMLRLPAPGPAVGGDAKCSRGYRKQKNTKGLQGKSSCLMLAHSRAGSPKAFAADRKCKQRDERLIAWQEQMIGKRRCISSGWTKLTSRKTSEAG